MAQALQSTGPKPRPRTPPTEGIQPERFPLLVLVHPGQKSLKTEGLPELKSWDPAQVSRATSGRLLVCIISDTEAHPEDGLQFDSCLQIHFLPCQRKGRRPLVSLLPRVFSMTTQEAKVRLLLMSTSHPGDTVALWTCPQAKNPPSLESSVFRCLLSSPHPSRSALRLVIDIHGCCAVDGVRGSLRL